jgi:hypothetical protein
MLGAHFLESQVFRSDHYLGKEGSATVLSSFAPEGATADKTPAIPDPSAGMRLRFSQLPG